MQSWLGHKLISFVMGRTRAGDVRPTLLLDHPDVHLTFPGTSSWSGVFRGKAEVEAWLRMSWGRLRECEVYEDTDKPELLDEYLREHRPALAA